MSIRAHADATLTQAQLEELAGKLADKRHELAAKLEVLTRQMTVKEDCSLTDAGEAASLREEVARASGVADQHKRQQGAPENGPPCQQWMRKLSDE